MAGGNETRIVIPHGDRRYRASLKEWWFEVKWMWRHRRWKPTRQKMKAFDRDLELYLETGKTPW